jgi:hypothetical protein
MEFIGGPAAINIIFGVLLIFFSFVSGSCSAGIHFPLLSIGNETKTFEVSFDYLACHL